MHPLLAAILADPVTAFEDLVSQQLYKVTSIWHTHSEGDPPLVMLFEKQEHMTSLEKLLEKSRHRHISRTWWVTFKNTQSENCSKMNRDFLRCN